ncbi:MAG TPA: hypothetical protein VGF52_01595, partial [Tepidisphaeraceae bacterium]
TILNIASLTLGWLILGLLCMQAWLGIRSRDWFWLAILIYSLALTMNWSHPTPRYLVPIAPLILVGVFKGLQIAPRFLARRLDRWMSANLLELRVRQLCTVLLWCFVISYIACNGALYAVDVYVARSQNFYDAYEAGIDRDLIYACRWLDAHPFKDGEVAVSELYINMGQKRISRFGLRATAMLTGKAIVSLPTRYTRWGDPHKSPVFLNWARVIGIKYLLYQPEVSPWRVFHFRMGWLQELMTHEPAVDTGAGWRLYHIPPQGSEAIREPLEPRDNWPTRVPGL